MSWKPLLEGALKDGAWQSLQEILGDLAPPGRDSADDPSLAGGTTGLAVLHGYLAQAGCGKDSPATARECLRRATASVANHPMEASLYSGLTGVGWALAHLGGRLPGLDGEDDAAEIDEAVLEHLDRSPWADDYDLISGLVGFGVYALERLPRPAARACLERVIQHLAETAEHPSPLPLPPKGRGVMQVTWWTNPAWLPAETREKVPQGYYNLGLAHGVPGVIALLGQACAAGVARARARPLLEGAVRWLLAQQGPRGFAAWVGPEEYQPTRLAWCYGDPGIAAALLGAARCVGEPGWEREARAIARRAARRPPEEAGVVDAGLCHGAVGLGHVFNRMYQATGEAALGEAARFWFDRTLALRRPGEGIGGYCACQPGEGGARAWVVDPGLLTGAAGIALALLAATTAVEPAWDRVLLISIPAQGAAP
jgi:hypothetical protein